jgi:hypothetical protein
MTTEALKAALDKAKDLYNHGKFTTLELSEFFKAMEEGLATPDVETTKVKTKKELKEEAKAKEE